MKKEFKDLKPEDLLKLVGTVTISFRVKPETKLNLQIAAEKYKVSFAKFCENLIENKLTQIENTEALKEKIKEKAEAIKKADIEPTEKKEIIKPIEEIEYYTSKEKLIKRVKELGLRNNNFYGVKERQKVEIRIKLNYYIVERISFKEWTLIKIEKDKK